MNEVSTHRTTVAPAAPLRREERINDVSARPLGDDPSPTPVGDPPPDDASKELSAPNEADARELGYTDASGQAIETAKSHDGTRLGPV